MKILTPNPDIYIVGLCDRCLQPIIKADSRGIEVYSYRHPILYYGEFIGRYCMKCVEDSANGLPPSRTIV